jgi:hypothetical protein
LSIKVEKKLVDAAPVSTSRSWGSKDLITVMNLVMELSEHREAWRTMADVKKFFDHVPAMFAAVISTKKRRE